MTLVCLHFILLCIPLSQAGMVTKLSTRASVLAATNPRKGWTPSRPLAEATSMTGPLLSRCGGDIIIVMYDHVHCSGI